MPPTFDDVAEGDSIDDFLISLAEGVAQAQAHLNEMPVPDASGAPAFVYHLPKVEFELKLQITTTKKGGRSPRLLKVFAPTSDEQATASSLLRGALVAAPVHNGRPPTVMSLSVDESTSGGLWVRVALGNALGESLEGVNVELNIDRERSAELNGGRALAAGTRLARSLAATGSDGRCQVKLTVGRNEPADTAVVITADGGGVSRALVYRVQR
jgi:hypothetical protein